MRKLTAVLSAFAMAVTLGACGEQGNGGGAGTGNDSGGSEQAATNLAALARSIGDSTAETNTAHMVFTADAAGEKVTGEGDVELGTADPAISMTMGTPEGSMTMVLVEGVLYIKMPQELQPGKPWVKIDSNSNAAMADALGTMTEQMRQNADPRATLDQFKNAGTITDQKEEELNGERTTHYSITVDAEKLAAEQTDPTAKEALEKAGVEQFPVELWINEDDLPVRVKVDMPMSDPASGKSMDSSVQVDYTNWGEPVEIVAPPAAQVAEMPR